MHNRNYNVSKQYIDKSIGINNEANYPSGILFALMARAYLEYAQENQISVYTQKQIKSILKQGLVYQYFELPLCIMKRDDDTLKQLEHKYQWVNFSYTVKQYKEFLSAISKHFHN